MQQLQADTAALQTMATNWSATAAELTSASTPLGTGSLLQPSVVAVSAAHADVAAFTAALATRVDQRASHVGDARASYITGEAQSASQLSALGD